jgi:hypothetical protein
MSMKNLLQTTLIAALICVPQVGYAQQQPQQSTAISKVRSLVLCASMPVLAGYRWLNTPDTTMPTLESLKVATIVPIEPHEVQDMSKVLVDKKAIKKTLSKSSMSELLRMFIPWYKKHTPVDETILINNQYYKVQEGIPANIAQHQNITIRSGGCYDPRAYSAYVGVKAGNTHGPCITFSYPTSTRAAFNYCQEQDVSCIDLIYQDVVKKSPQANISLYGTCKGGTNILRFLAEKAEHNEDVSNVKAVALESPTISVKHAIGQYGIHPFVGMIFPNYNPRAKTILDAKKMPAHVPIFIGRLENDTVSKFDHTNQLVRHLNAVGSQNQTYLLTTTESDIRHGLLGKAKDYHQALNTFYQVHNLPHTQDINEQLLKRASAEALEA